MPVVMKSVSQAQPRRLVWILMLSTKSTSRVMTTGKSRIMKKRKNEAKSHLQSHLFNKHRDAYDVADSVNEERRDDIVKKRIPKSKRFDEIVNSNVD